jgi:hypothetical protein
VSGSRRTVEEPKQRDGHQHKNRPEKKRKEADLLLMWCRFSFMPHELKVLPDSLIYKQFF